MKLLCCILLFAFHFSYGQDHEGKYLSFADAFKNPNAVLELQLSGITGKIPAEIASLKNLKTVRLIELRSDFDLNDAFEKLGKYTSVKNLYLYGNPHKTLPVSLSKIQSLEFIQLNRNLAGDLESIMSQLAKIKNFKSLSLSSMNLSSLPESIGLLMLTSLDLENNPRLNLDKTFELLSKQPLTTLNLNSAGFKVVPASISKLVNLKRLELQMMGGDFNNEESFTNLAKLKKLEELDIQGNFFGQLDPSVKKLNYLKLIEIDGNCIVEDNYEALKKLLPKTKIQNEIPC